MTLAVSVGDWLRDCVCEPLGPCVGELVAEGVPLGDGLVAWLRVAVRVRVAVPLPVCDGLCAWLTVFVCDAVPLRVPEGVGAPEAEPVLLTVGA